jgi:hypothetical protein
MNPVKNSVTKVLDGMEGTVGKVEKEMETLMQPVQNTVFSRFPILFTLLVTFGVSTTFLALERIVTSFTYLNEHPFVMLSIGLVVLALTGTLYKKLG